MIRFDRDDLIDGLRELVEELHAAGEPVGLRIVGGGALVLPHFDRRTTVDLDAVHVRPGSETAVVTAAERVADRRGWQLDWLRDGWVQTVRVVVTDRSGKIISDKAHEIPRDVERTGVFGQCNGPFEFEDVPITLPG